MMQNLPQNIQSKIMPEPMSGCWIWIGYRNNDDYGRMSFLGKILLAHRVVFQIMKGEILAGNEVCHSCDNPSCVNPDHLFQGSRSDNMKDMVLKNRSYKPTGKENHFSKLTEDLIAAIRKDTRSNRIIGHQYGVSKGCIAKIKRGETWTHVPYDDGDQHYIPLN